MECRYQNVIPYLKHCASSAELAIDWANPNSSRFRGSFGSNYASSVCVCVFVCVSVVWGGGETGFLLIKQYSIY